MSAPFLHLEILYDFLKCTPETVGKSRLMRCRLHGAASANGAQNYPQCFNVVVTGSGTKTLPEGTAGTALYKADEKGILINPYTKITSYAMPGPTLWTG